jgi:hypothetical protein
MCLVPPYREGCTRRVPFMVVVDYSLPLLYRSSSVAVVGGDFLLILLFALAVVQLESFLRSELRSRSVVRAWMQKTTLIRAASHKQTKLAG